MKLYKDMTDEEKFEYRASSLIHTSIEDAMASLKFVTKQVIVEALKREKESKFPRSTMIKMLEAAIRAKEKEETLVVRSAISQGTDDGAVL